MLEHIFAWTALLLVVEYMILANVTMHYRRTHKVPYDQKETIEITRWRRAHSNFNEYVPLFLILFYVLKTYHPSQGWYFSFAIAMVVGRLIHGAGLTTQEQKKRFIPRSIGMLLTMYALVGTTLYLFILALS